jgi:hypothetical protein
LSGILIGVVKETIALLKSGRLVSLTTPIRIPDKIQQSTVKMIFSTNNFPTFTILLKDNTLVYWSPCDTEIKEIFYPMHKIEKIFSNERAWLALFDDQSIFSWGHVLYGEEIPNNIKLTNVKNIYPSKNSFAAHLTDGRMFVWGRTTNVSRDINAEIYTSSSSIVLDGNWVYDVKEVVSNETGFVALLNDGNTIIWDKARAFFMLCEAEMKNNTKKIFANEGAFVAILNDDSIVTWGDQTFGGKISDQLTKKLKKNVLTIIPHKYTFTAICKNQKQYTWGYEFGKNYDEKEEKIEKNPSFIVENTKQNKCVIV